MEKLEGIKPGDRVRVTLEADYIGPLVGHDISRFLVQGAVYELHIVHKDATTFHIERIEKPLAVGDRVKDIAFGFGEGEILAVDGRHAFVRWDAKAYEAGSIYLSNLERIS